MGGFTTQIQGPESSSQPTGKSGPADKTAQTVQQPVNAVDSYSMPDGPNVPNQQPPQPMGKGGVQTNSATSGQPRMGQQNQYSNTVGQWDNTQIKPVGQQGKGKGG